MLLALGAGWAGPRALHKFYNSSLRLELVMVWSDIFGFSVFSSNACFTQYTAASIDCFAQCTAASTACFTQCTAASIKTIKHLTNYSILKLVFSKSVFLVSVLVNQMRPSLSSHLSTQFSKFFFSSYFYWRCTPKLILREGIKLLHNNLEQSW